MQKAQNYQNDIEGFDVFGLDPVIMKGIMHARYDTPTPVQKEVIPLAMKGADLIGTAQTGTGKTAAFVLPILNRLIKEEKHLIRALIVTPTRELAAQIDDNIRTLGRGTGIRSVTLYGGVSDLPQITALEQGVDIVVACPGRFIDLVYKGYVNTDNVGILVLDEADRMLDMGFLPDIKRILQFLPENRQSMLFSATFPPEIEALARRSLRDPKRVAIGLSKPANTVAHALFPVEQHLKWKLLLEILKTTDTDSVLVFTRTKFRADSVMKKIKHAGYKVTSLHSNRSQAQRQASLKGFKSGAYQIMVATDIAARGLDIDDISHVINYDMPATPDDYIHRIGRTGRAERTGDAFTLMTSEDDQIVKRLEKIMMTKIERRYLENFDYNASKPENTGTNASAGKHFNPNAGKKDRRPVKSTGNSRRGSRPRYSGLNPTG